MMKETLKSISGYLLAVTALIACPCHLVFLLPLVVGLLGGTALGAALAANTAIIIAAATVYFFVALGLGIHFLDRQGEDVR